MKSLKVFLISLFSLAWGLKVSACVYPEIDRWYMMCYCDDEFAYQYYEDMEAFWRDYTGQDWSTDEDRVNAALTKGDKAMAHYLTVLGKYEEYAEVDDDPWDYPTKAQIAGRTRALKEVAAECARHTTGKYADRWTLLQMRANMLLGNYTQNIKLWETRGMKFPDSCYKRMMRNIYANALLNTGKRNEAWDIYADQHDFTSILWSMRKYTNFAGIKKLYSESPNSTALEFLLQDYVNRVQEVLDCYVDSEFKYELQYYDDDSVYARIDTDYMKEINEFVEFAYKVAKEGKTREPGLWMTASALVKYFLMDYKAAKERIDEAMEMACPEPIHDATRRIRMLIYPAVSDVKSPEFLSFMTEELKWLSDEVETRRKFNARDRILNLGLSKAFLDAGDKNTAIALQALRNHYRVELFKPDGEDEWESEYFKMLADDHSSHAFEMLWSLSGDDLVKFKDFVNSKNNNPLAAYALACVDFSEDYLNDIIATKYLNELEFEKALPYLEKVSQAYLDNQQISYYASKRDYHIPDWYCYQSLNNYDDPQSPRKLKGNVKLDYCKEMIDLYKQYEAATGDARKKLAYTLASYLFQASGRGQCWFLTNYSASSPLVDKYWSEYGYDAPDYGISYEHACQLLAEAAESTDKDIRALALFALVDATPDEWAKEEWSSLARKFVYNPVPDSQQYRALCSLTSHLASCTSVPSEISRCDVLKQFRKYR